MFSTKNRCDLLSKPISSELYSYTNTILKNLDCVTYGIGGTNNHIHILCSLSKKHAMSDVIVKIKTGTSRWIKTKNEMFKNFYWQRGYGAFSISPSHKNIICNYIANQEQHHKQITFEDELRKILKKYQTNYDEKYLLD